MKKLLPVLASLLLATSTAWAAPCPSTTLDTYLVPGFGCSIGSVQFDNFQWGSNSVGGAFEHVNLPDAILVTPQDAPGGAEKRAVFQHGERLGAIVIPLPTGARIARQDNANTASDRASGL